MEICLQDYSRMVNNIAEGALVSIFIDSIHHHSTRLEEK